MLKSSLQNKLLTTLPDDRPITAIQIVENIEKCPFGFNPIIKTYDQDQEADLRESSIFKSSSARFLCLSKTEGLPNFVVKEITIVGEKLNPPQGFSLLNRTVDTEQKAWKKKKICYRLVNLKETETAVTDIIVCNRLKKAPTGFHLAGELNGVTICYKMGNVQDTPAKGPQTGTTNNAVSPVYPTLNNGEDHDYEILLPNPPYHRPAPKPPTSPLNPVPALPTSHTNTLGNSHNSMEGVPFVINPKFITSSTADKIVFPRIKARTMQQLLSEYNYSFAIERQT